MHATYFPDAASFRRRLARHHASARALVVGFHKKASGTPSITDPEALDEALCFGWIDGVRRSVDATRYTIRFTPRKPNKYRSAQPPGYRKVTPFFVTSAKKEDTRERAPA